MRLEQLEYLLTISQSKSLNDAARTHHISQQAMSAAIKSLEEELGVQLLDRTFHGVTVNQAGKQLVPFAQKTLDEYRALKERLLQINDDLAAYRGLTHLTIYTNVIYTFQILPPLLMRLHRLCPQICTDVFTFDSAEITEKMLKHPDRAVGLLNIPGEDNYKNFCRMISQHDLNIFHIQKSTLKFYVSKDFPLAQAKQLSLKTILKYPIVLYSHSHEDYKNYVAQGFADYGEMRFSVVTSSYEIWLNAIKNNLGIGILLDCIAYSNINKRRDFDDLIVLNVKEQTITAFLACIYAAPAAEAELFLRLLAQQTQA